ncbi:sugar phosphate isomerase/epimerase family protein [Hoeflea prorocentri]|uniref:Sugar phosphate isomerase/epimerase n=1 Tax=Hoeflea prorocentri TaxID=1922333 RepID=A0A9X3ULY0_9HYPH|nr:sugar phosphate isomerase/epimerase family protein [Hoeflea prorocentri]MCY6383034.1 sugar phosphate isomerase/epimerase [Hoeflea prorocentri]MDA5400834.1 sugar phosphate isomerase/epimerase [Hoeflea prorocentri]
MKQPELVATYWTMNGDCAPDGQDLVSPIDFRERVEMARDVGYVGIGFHHADVMSVSARLGFDEMKRILDDNGMKYVEVEMITDWFVSGERRKRSDQVRKDLLHAAERLGAWHIKIGGDFDNDGRNDWPMDHMIREYEILCREAADAGTRLSLEILPFANLATIDQGVALRNGAGVDNGGVLVDIWHIARGGMSYDQVRDMPKEAITWVELNDALPEVQGTLFYDTVHCRELPGDGCFDVPAFLHALHDAGYEGPYGVEILSDKHRQLPLFEQAKQGFDATMRQFELLDQRLQA